MTVSKNKQLQAFRHKRSRRRAMAAFDHRKFWSWYRKNWRRAHDAGVRAALKAILVGPIDNGKYKDYAYPT